MTSKVIKYIRLIGSEFKDESDELLTEYIEMYKPYVSRKQFGNLYEQTLAYFICHKMKMNGMGVDAFDGMGSPGAACTVSSVSEGGSSISFSSNMGSNTGNDAEFGMTSYGIQYLQLRRMVIIPIHCGDYA